MALSDTLDGRTDEPQWQRLPVLVGALALVTIAVLAGDVSGWRQAAAVVIGGVAGFALYHAAFGFTAAWRRMVVERRGVGLRAQMLLIGLTVIIAYPMIAWGSPFGGNVSGFVMPYGTGMFFGAFVFGFGMQFGAGCASGTLFTTGGGSVRMLIVLAFFILGSLIGTVHAGFWSALPRMRPYSMLREWGVAPALLVTLAALAVIWFLSIRLERSAHGNLEAPRKTGTLLHGPWSPVLGALALVVVAVATLAILGRPWGITSGFALWGAKIAWAIGVPIDSWPAWQNRMGQVEASVLRDATSVMNFGIIFGAMIAAGLAARFRPKMALSLRELATAIFGGLLMGYGARLAYGCNIGAYFGGIVSGSLHGWFWLVFAYIGSALALRLKSRFAL